MEARNWTVTTVSSKLCLRRSRSTCSMMGLLTTGSSGFGWLAVIGRSLVPSPPAITTALTASLRSLHDERAPAGLPRPRTRSSAAAPAGRRPAGLPGLPARCQQPAGLLGVERGGPPVQCSSPERECPTDDRRRGGVRGGVRPEEEQGKRVEQREG